MLFPFLKIGNRNIAFSEIYNINGKEQIRIYSDEPNRQTKTFNELEFYLPDYRLTKLVGYSDQDVKSIMNHVKWNEEIVWESAREETHN